MTASIAANALLLIHLGFVLFVALGGLLVLKWRRAAWVHLPCAAWGVLIEFTGWICPLTPLENHFRRLAGEAGYDGGFLQHYVWPVLYPGGLTRGMQVALGLAVLALNLYIYWGAFRKVGQKRQKLT